MKLTEKLIRRNLLLRISFFVIYFLLTVHIISVEGLNFVAILFASFAARDFVQGVRMAKFYMDIQRKNNKKKNSNPKK